MQHTSRPGVSNLGRLIVLRQSSMNPPSDDLLAIVADSRRKRNPKLETAGDSVCVDFNYKYSKPKASFGSAPCDALPDTSAFLKGKQYAKPVATLSTQSQFIFVSFFFFVVPKKVRIAFSHVHTQEPSRKTIRRS